jgi:hypothetical protein
MVSGGVCGYLHHRFSWSIGRLPVTGGKFAVAGIAQDDLEGLQRTVKGGADFGVLHVETKGGGVIVIGGSQINR